MAHAWKERVRWRERDRESCGGGGEMLTEGKYKKLRFAGGYFCRNKYHTARCGGTPSTAGCWEAMSLGKPDFGPNLAHAGCLVWSAPAAGCPYGGRLVTLGPPAVGGFCGLKGNRFVPDAHWRPGLIGYYDDRIRKKHRKKGMLQNNEFFFLTKFTSNSYRDLKRIRNRIRREYSTEIVENSSWN